MNPRGTVSPEDAEHIRAAKAELDAADAEREKKHAAFVAVVRDVTTRSSIRETATTAGLSTRTVRLWKTQT